jgi:hypothetical protein
MEEIVQVQGINILLAAPINPTKGIENHKGMVLSQDLLLDFTLPYTLGLLGDYSSHQLHRFK